MKLLLSLLFLLATIPLIAQKGYLITYEERSINGELSKLAAQLPPEARDRMQSFEYVTRTYQLTYIDGISQYQFSSACYDYLYGGKQYDASDSGIYYKDIRSIDSAEVIGVSNRRGCVKLNFPTVEEYDITDSTKVYGNIVVQKAVRKDNLNVIVWFAPQIPIPDGPKSLSGFPGLVTEYITHSYQTVMMDIQEVDVSTLTPISRPDCPKLRTHE